MDYKILCYWSAFKMQNKELQKEWEMMRDALPTLRKDHEITKFMLMC